MPDRDADQRAAMEAAAPVLPTMYEILDDAVAFYFGEAYTDMARADHDDRAVANCIYSHAEKGMLAASGTVGGLHPIKIRGLFVLNYRDRALMRVKKVDANGQHRNYQTKQQKEYDRQLPLPGLPDPAFRLTAGYQLDAAGSSLERVIIARPMGSGVFWAVQLSVEDGVADWQDITPQRFAGTEGIDLNKGRARGRGV